MNPRTADTTAPAAGRSRPTPRDFAATAARILTSSAPALDWAKGRLLLTIGTAALFVWAAVVLAGALLPDDGRADVDAAGADDAGEILAADGAADGDAGRVGRLRDDLFGVVRIQRQTEAVAPRTNPVDLLQMLELQGVLGGDRPRALIMYKRTRETVTVGPGDDLGEFKVMEIKEGSVVLQWRNELLELSL